MSSANSAIFKAIAHPTRREILALLAASDRSVKEITEAFRMSQPAISQHLRELRGAKLVSSQKVGAKQKYHLTAQPLKVVYEWSAQYRGLFDVAGHAWQFVPAKAAAEVLPKKERNRRGG